VLGTACAGHCYCTVSCTVGKAPLLLVLGTAAACARRCLCWACMCWTLLLVLGTAACAGHCCRWALLLLGTDASAKHCCCYGSDVRLGALASLTEAATASPLAPCPAISTETRFSVAHPRYHTQHWIHWCQWTQKNWSDMCVGAGPVDFVATHVQLQKSMLNRGLLTPKQQRSYHSLLTSLARPRVTPTRFSGP
jgi:hypothetical protein